MNEFDNKSWVHQAKTLLDQSADALDAATLSRLNRARQVALAHARPRSAQRWFLPAGLAGASMLMLAVATWHSYAPSGGLALPLTAAASSSGSEFDLVSGDEGLELYQNLEFYAWLDAQDQDFDG